LTADIWGRIREALAGNAGEPANDESTLRALWRKRARDLARPVTQEDEGLLWGKFIVLRAGKERYAFRVDDVEEVMRVPPITPVPCVPPHFLGVVNRRGNILPVVDLKVFFGEERTSPTRNSRVVVLSRSRLSLGLLVEGADKILGIPEESIRPPLRNRENLHDEFCAGVMTLERKVVVLIDSWRLLQDDRMKVDKGV
jgi:purine-binding chemotaxis protein CheW